jgi:iron(III) transport system substrate-binding protein
VIAGASPGAAPAPAASGPANAPVAPAPVTAGIQPLLDGARKEGQVTVYSLADPSILARLQTAVQDGYGITLNFQRLVDAQLEQRFGAEADADNVQADVIMTGDPGFADQAVGKGWLAKIDSLPALASWPRDFWNGAYARVGVGTVGMAWNSNVVGASDAPKDWTDAVKPVFQGKLVMADPRTAAANMAWVYVMRQWFGDDFLKRIAAQNPVWTQSVVPGAQSLASGAAGLQIPAVHAVIVSLIGQGAPIKELTPDRTTGVETLAAVTTGAPHPSAARLLLNYILTPAGQALLNANGTSPLPNIPGTTSLPSQYVSPPIVEAAAQSDQLVSLLGLQ